MNQPAKFGEQGPERKGRRRHPISVVLAGGDETQRTVLRAALDQIHAMEIDCQDEEAPPKAGAPPALLMLILDCEHSDTWRREVRRRNFDKRFASVIALLSDDDSPSLLRAALRAGADDVLAMPPSPEQAYHTLLRMSELSHRYQGAREKIVCSLVSLTGGVGVSDLAVNLGLAMHRLFDKRTALAELDLQAAPLAVLLNQEPEHTVIELADPTSAIDSIRLESVLCKHDSGLYWLAAPGRIEEAELVSAATVEAILKVLREMFEVVLIDCGSHLTESSITAWEHSDHLLYLVDQSVTSIRAAQRYMSLYERLGLKEIETRFVLNRYLASSPITRERIETALGQPLYAILPRDDKSYGEQQVSGADLWQIRSAGAVRESIEELARKLYHAQSGEVAEPQPGLLGRLMRAFGSGRPHNGTN
jgi:pilus assembly protein CpaE